MSIRVLGIAFLALWVACDRGDTDKAPKPTGTPTDPVEVCERVADVCRLDGAKLGVCVEATPGAAACQGKSPCFVCQSQH